MSSAFDGLGTVIAFSIDAVTYTSLAEVAKITGPNIEAKEIDVSNLQSVSGWMEFIPGMVNAGELSMELNFLGSSLALLLPLYRVPGVFWRIVLPDGGTLIMVGFLAKTGVEIPHDDKVSMNVTIKLTGIVSFVSGLT
jgi:predicted secreted protein